MRGQIIERNGHYSVVVSYKDPVTGKWYKKWKAAGDSISKAEKLRTKLLSDNDNGLITKPGKLNLSTHLDTWLRSAPIMTLSPRTIENYEYLIAKYIKPELGSVFLSNLAPDRISQFESNTLGKDGKKIRTVQMCHLILHKSLGFALKQNLIARNPVEVVTPPKTQKREMQVLTEKEIILVLELARDTAFYPLLYLALFSGMRRGELLGLRWGDISYDLGTVSVQRAISHMWYGSAKGKTVAKSPKTNKSKRQIPLSESTLEVLHSHYQKTLEIRRKLNPDTEDTKLKDEDHVKPDDYIFSNNYLGQPFDPHSASRAWSRLAKKAGIKNVRFHDLRHTFASLALKNNIHLKVVSEILGHASTSITADLYSHVSPTLQRDAVNKIDNLVFGSSAGSKN